MAGWIVLTWLISGDLSARQPAFNHIRSEEARVQRLVGVGYQRSATFRSLVDAVEQSPCIVYIATTVNLSQGMTGALLHVAAGSREQPILRVLIKTGLSTEEAIATIGHELQHVTEAVSGASTSSAVDFTVFERLDRAPGTTSDGRKYETGPAIMVTGWIRKELRLSRQVRKVD